MGRREPNCRELQTGKDAALTGHVHQQNSRRKEPSGSFRTVESTSISALNSFRCHFRLLSAATLQFYRFMLLVSSCWDLIFNLSNNNRLLDLSSEQLRDVVHARARRRFNRGLKRKPMGLIKKLRKAKQEAKPNEKPDLVKTHLRDMIVVPEMIGSVIGIYSGKEFNQVEIKPEMVGHYLGEFSIT